MENSSNILTIIHFNDVYNIEEKTNEPVGGIARFKTALDSFADRNPLILFSGDLFEPSLLSSVYNGEQMMKPMERFKVDAACFGNHDFDLEYDLLTEYIQKMKFPWILSNVKTRLDHKPLAEGKETLVINKNGLKIGILGLAESDWVFDVSSIDLDDILYEDFIKSARRVTKYLRDVEKCDFIIALTHMRTPNDKKLANEFDGIDLILGGHDHVNTVEKVNGTYIIKSGSDFAEFNTITIKIHTPEAVSALQPEAKEKIYKNKYEIDIKTTHVTKEFAPDAELQEHTLELFKQFEGKTKQAVLYTQVDLETRFELVRSSEQNFSNFIADVVRFNSGCDVVLINTGSIRSNCVFKAGVMSQGDIRLILPWEDMVMKVRMTGAQIHQALENGVSTYPALDGRFLAVSGITYAFDPSKPSGNRVPLESIKIKEHPLNLEAKYTLATLLFMYKGKDGFTVFNEVEKLNEEVTAEEVHVILKKLFTLPKDQKIVEEFKRQALDITNSFDLMKPPSLQRRISEIKRMDFFQKMKIAINDMVLIDDEYLIAVKPQIENRVTKL